MAYFLGCQIYTYLSPVLLVVIPSLTKKGFEIYCANFYLFIFFKESRYPLLKGRKSVMSNCPPEGAG